jgi:MYXO-CTERM domain-containing protein
MRPSFVFTLRHLALYAALGASTLAAPSWAAFVGPSGNGDLSRVPLYRGFVFGGIDTNAATDPGYFFQDILDSTDYTSNTTPLNYVSGGGTRSANGATLSGNGWSSNSGFMAARNYASITVNNAQTTDDYYLVAGQGGAAKVHFAAGTTPAQATFTWHVSGTASTGPYGLAQSRLDFAATTTQLGSFNNIYDPSVAGISNQLGPGTYSYTVPLSGISQDVYLYYWSSAFALLSHGSAPQGAGSFMTADFSSTYVLTDVDLFDANGDEISSWTMTDENSSGQLLFNQDGRQVGVNPAPDPNTVPEPTPAALLLAALAGLALRQGRRRRVARG